MEVWNTVKVNNKDLERDGTAGVVHALDPADQSMVEVKFDTDGECEWVNVADLILLKGN